ncbi:MULTISPECIES: DUF2510 domain-containing protein [unclassified Modestobacter]
MTAPGGVAPAGWYPDPDGAPGLVRWWNGESWSDVTTPAGPGVQVGQAFEATTPPAGQPEAGWEAWSAGSPAPARRSRRPLLVGLGALLVVALVVLVGVLVGRSGDDPATAPVARPSSEPGTPFPPGTVRIIDEDAGISYPWLGDGWSEWDRGDQVETTATAGQYFVTQEELPGDFDSFIAQCTSGPLVPAFGWTGPGSLQMTTTTIADFVRYAHYPGPNERTVRRDEAVTVDGAPAWVYEFDLTWDVEGYDATGERAALLLIDVGREAPALLYVSVPNTHAELYGVVDRVLASVEVL